MAPDPTAKAMPPCAPTRRRGNRRARSPVAPWTASRCWSTSTTPGTRPTASARAGDEATLARSPAGCEMAGAVRGQPDTVDAWRPERLDTSSAARRPSRQWSSSARAEEYFHGHLDWYALERSRDEPGGEAGARRPCDLGQRFDPGAADLRGMPNTRWWEFEDGGTNFGEVRPDTTDLGKLLLLEFGLVYANDWFVVPYTLPVGTADHRARRRHHQRLRRAHLGRAGQRPSLPAWDRWSMYQLTGSDRERALILLPADQPGAGGPGPGTGRDGARRDGQSRLRHRAARLAAHGDEQAGRRGQPRAAPPARGDRRPAPGPAAAVAPIRYQVMNTVPEHWVPFLPVHQPGSTRETRLQRAAMPRLLGADPAAFDMVEPRTSLLREGLDATPARQLLRQRRRSAARRRAGNPGLPADALARRRCTCGSG